MTQTGNVEKLAVIGTSPMMLGFHKPKVIVLSTCEKIVADVCTKSRLRAISVARRLAKSAGLVIVDTTCSKCNKSGIAEYARGQRDGLLSVIDQINLLKGQMDELYTSLEKCGADSIYIGARVHALDEATREAQALLERVGKGGEDNRIILVHEEGAQERFLAQENLRHNRPVEEDRAELEAIEERIIDLKRIIENKTRQAAGL